jgi:septal ring factor EnvC (AmiA/AmiB activator)
VIIGSVWRSPLRAGILEHVGRVVIGGLVVAIIAAILFYFYSQSCRTRAAAQAQQISEMGNRLNQLQQDNEQLKSELAKSQEEENKLNAQNTELLRAIGTFDSTKRCNSGRKPSERMSGIRSR